VVQITSPNPEDGKSTLTANLAVSIAQSGKRILLIDADLRKPQVHKIFGVGGDVGLVSVITGEVDPAEAIQPSAIPGLSLLPCGPVPPNPAELLTAPRFKDLLDVLREQFDFVLIDTPPLLAVTDPSVVAPRVDGVLLTVRITKNGRPAAERAKEMLDTLGANVLGVVVNGIDRNNGAGSYAYGYGYGGYGYGSEKYHEEAEQPAVVRNGPPRA
jgi:capsular exopolysaccharide synthesis family protein